MYVYIYKYHTCVFIHMYVHICMCISIYIYVRICAFMFMYNLARNTPIFEVLKMSDSPPAAAPGRLPLPPRRPRARTVLSSQRALHAEASTRNMILTAQKAYETLQNLAIPTNLWLYEGFIQGSTNMIFYAAFARIEGTCRTCHRRVWE